VPTTNMGLAQIYSPCILQKIRRMVYGRNFT
jgi:hypothetical protein